MANGNVVVPLDIQLNVSGLAEAINNADLDYVFYDWDNYEIVTGAMDLGKEQLGDDYLLKGAICMQNRKHVENIKNIWKFAVYESARQGREA